MIELKSTLPGKRALYGDACVAMARYGIEMGGNWDFDKGMFDTILHQDDDDKIYLRLPFDVIEGMLDHEGTLIEFGQPFIIRHILNIGLDNDDSPVLASVGLDQFQSPDDPDAPIYNDEWVRKGEEVVSHVADHPVFNTRI